MKLYKLWIKCLSWFLFCGLLLPFNLGVLSEPWCLQCSLSLLWQQQLCSSGRGVSTSAAPRRKVQFVSRQFAKHAGVSLSRPGHLRVSGLSKHLKASNKYSTNNYSDFGLTNTKLRGRSPIFYCGALPLSQSFSFFLSLWWGHHGSFINRENGCWHLVR